MKANQTLDTTGMHCPLPILRTSKKIELMENEKTLLIMADDENFKPDIEAWCKSTGNKLVHMEEKDGVISAWVKKSD